MAGADDLSMALLARSRTPEPSPVPTFKNVAAAAAAGWVPSRFPGRVVRFTEGGAGATTVIGISDGTKWKLVSMGADVL